jgi:Na+-driven multidrug efflux pump
MAVSRHFTVRRRVRAPFLVAIAANLANIALNAVLVPRFGFAGAPFSTVLARVFQCFLMLGASVSEDWRSESGDRLVFDSVGCDAFRRIFGQPGARAKFAVLARLAAPSAAMLALEAWQFEATTLMAATLGSVELGGWAAGKKWARLELF